MLVSQKRGCETGPWNGSCGKQCGAERLAENEVLDNVTYHQHVT